MNELFTSALLIEDERNLIVALEIALSKLKIPTRHASTIMDAEKLIEAQTPDFILLDRSLPDGDGLELCASLRDQGFVGTILVLTARGETDDKIKGLNAGADDYLSKPFSWEELDARIRALARRRPVPSSEARKKAASPALWTLDPQRQRIFAHGGWVELTQLEYKLAAQLISAEGAILTRDDLLKDVWGFTLLPKTRTVDHFLGRLRKYFEENPEKPRHFLTVRGAGYRFEINASPGSTPKD